MRIAIIGTGISGNVAAYRLRDEHDITVFESASRIGGHSNTVDVYDGGRRVAIDTGFIVFNDRTYPNFVQLLQEIGQESRPGEMSFSVQAPGERLEYKGSSLDTLFAQRSNLFRPSFHRMLRDILRFNREAGKALVEEPVDRTLGDYLAGHGYSRQFAEHYLVPMAAAIWSAEPASVPDMPVQFLVRFFANHGLLQLRDRPQWRVIAGGSREYVRKLVAGHRDRIRLNCRVRAIRRRADYVEIQSDSAGTEIFDSVFIACHSDQALALLADATPDEREVLGAMPYQRNEAILHTDSSVMPRRRRAWAAWNYHVPLDPRGHVAVTYNMNALQALDTRENYFVTLNDDGRIRGDRVIRRIQYDHPVFSAATPAAQARQPDLNTDRTYFCGAYWRNGFHEDGVVSALDAIAHFNARRAHGKLYLRRAG